MQGDAAHCSWLLHASRPTAQQQWANSNSSWTSCAPASLPCAADMGPDNADNIQGGLAALALGDPDEKAAEMMDKLECCTVSRGASLFLQCKQWFLNCLLAFGAQLGPAICRCAAAAACLICVCLALPGTSQDPAEQAALRQQVYELRLKSVAASVLSAGGPSGWSAQQQLRGPSCAVEHPHQLLLLCRCRSSWLQCR